MQMRRRLSGLLIRQTAERESELLKALATVKEPISGLPLTSLDLIRNISVKGNNEHTAVSFDIDTLVPGYPEHQKLRQRCLDTIRDKLDWVKEAEVGLISRALPLNTDKSTGLVNIKHIIAVSSCKGGVGKSTVAVNLAYALSRLDNNGEIEGEEGSKKKKEKKRLKIGLLDADIYGPSVPFLTQPDDPEARLPRSKLNPKFILPLEAEGIKVLSFGHVNPRAGVVGAGGQGAAVLRGPVASRVINQLAAATEWGDLDYLIIDFPPGTGDIPLTLCQSIHLSGAVIVTTPHPLAMIDVMKGLQMFSDVKVPLLAVVENMSHFICDHGEKYFPFGEGGKDRMLQYLSQPFSPSSSASSSSSENNLTRETLQRCPFISLPLLLSIKSSSSTSSEPSQDPPSSSLSSSSWLRPVVLSSPTSAVATSYQHLAQECIREVFRQQVNAIMVPTLSIDDARGGVLLLRYFTPSSAIEFQLTPLHLRCRDPKSGAKLAKSTEELRRLEGVRAISYDVKGNYGVAISWSDGHYADIYSFDTLRRIAEEEAKDKSSIVF